jgi:hypothetical protein
MDDIVFNAMTGFQFFCNDYFKQKNIDKLMPRGMSRSDWNTRKEVLLNEEIESVNRYLDEQALLRLQNYTASANKQDIEKRFTIIIKKVMDSYKSKIKDYYLY